MFVTSDGFLHSSSNGLKLRIFGAQRVTIFRANTLSYFSIAHLQRPILEGIYIYNYIYVY